MDEIEVSSEELKQPWTQPAEGVLDALGVTADEGLSPSQVEERRERFGRNRLRDVETKSALQIFIEQFQSLIIWLLVVAAALSFVFGELVEGVAIVAVILINALIGFVTELRAVRSMEALQKLGSMPSKVIRDGGAHEVPADDLVPGDIVLLEGGDVVTADMRLIEASKLQANESALTGESVPVGKNVEPVGEDVPLAEREDMIYKGTAITRGAGTAVVVATGMDTELGAISSLVEQAEEEATPLEERLQELGRRLIWVTLTIGAFVAVAGVIAGRDLFLMIETAIALAVASIPEGLPIVATIALARGMWRMANRNALINKLSAVETLGATNVILTDKTGTLTENQMTVTKVVLPVGEFTVTGEGLKLEGKFKEDDDRVDPGENGILHRALEVGVLCNNAAIEEGDDGAQAEEAIGDPMEVALLVAGLKAGIDRDELLEQMPEAREVAFEPRVKMMATFNESDSGYRVAVKGAAEAVLDVSSHIVTADGKRELTDKDREEWLRQNEQMAENGLRLLALASREAETIETDPYQDLTFLGLIALLDPPRSEVRPSIEAAQGAGIRVVMVTGDQPPTAKNVALAVGLVEENDIQVVRGSDLRELDSASKEERQRMVETNIFARVDPKQKLDLISLHQDAGAIVAMTGDGVNDAPALKKADIGVAMGERGTQVAKEAADMVLKDDAFSTIVAAIEQGRTIFNNIRKFVLYLLSCNVAEIMVVSLASIVNAPLPIRPLQILFLNLVTDVFPALALGVSEGDPAIMDRPPRDPDEPIMTRRHWTAVAGYGAMITAAVLGALALALQWLGMAQERAVTISFLTLAFAQLWHVFDMRDLGSSFLRNDVIRNRYVWGAIALCALLLLVAVYVPILADVLSVVDPGPEGWGLVLGMSVLPTIVGQVLRQRSIL